VTHALAFQKEDGSRERYGNQTLKIKQNNLHSKIIRKYNKSGTKIVLNRQF
jgi:hypothetical protein